MMRLPDKARVARRIRTMMEVRNLGLDQAAKACEMPVPSLESYLKGANMPGGSAVAKLSQGLRVSADWLLSGEDH